MSGSDQRALNWGKIFIKKGYTVTVLTHAAGTDRYTGFDYIITAKDSLKGDLGIATGYVFRGIKASGILSNMLKESSASDAVIYSSSDLLPDSIPAIYAIIRNPSLKWIAGLHLVAPNPFKGFKKIFADGYTVPALSALYYFLTQRLVMRFMKKYAHTVMVSNSMDREFLLNKKGFLPDKVIVTYGAVDWAAVDKAKQKLSYDACYVGRFHKQKGFFDLIEAWKLVCRKFPDSEIAIVGNDVNFDEVVEIVKKSGLTNNVKLLGFLNGIEKFNVMKASKICVFPSTYESFGMVAAEAMACGLPVVAYDLPIYKEIYPSGMLKADIGDIGSLAECIIELIENEKLRLKMSREAYKSSQRFVWEKTAEKILGRLK